MLAATAYVLARAAYADLDISEDETSAMEDELTASCGLDQAQAVLVVEMAKLQERTAGETSAPATDSVAMARTVFMR